MQQKAGCPNVHTTRRGRLEKTLMRSNLTDEILLRALAVLDSQRPKLKPSVQMFRLFHGLDGVALMQSEVIAAQLGVTKIRVRSGVADTQIRLHNPYVWEQSAL